MSAETSRYGRKLQMIIGETTGKRPDRRIVERLARMLTKAPREDVPESVAEFIDTYELEDRIREVIAAEHLGEGVDPVEPEQGATA